MILSLAKGAAKHHRVSTWNIHKLAVMVALVDLPMSQRWGAQISRAVGVDRTSTHRALHSLMEGGLACEKRDGYRVFYDLTKAGRDLITELQPGYGR